MARRIYWASIKKWAEKVALPTITTVGLLFLYLVSINAMIITGYSNDSICAGTPEDPCYAYINATFNTDVYVYPTDYDPWGRNTSMSFDPAVKEYHFYRSWGSGWREIKLNETCKGTWCGCANGQTCKFAYKFKKGQDYQFKIEAYKYSPYDDIKWGFGNIDPIWYGTDKISRGPSWEEHCNKEGTCWRALYSGTRFIEKHKGHKDYVPMDEVVNVTYVNDSIVLSWWDKRVVLEPYIEINNNKYKLKNMPASSSNPNVPTKNKLKFLTKIKDNKYSYYYNHTMDAKLGKSSSKKEVFNTFGYNISESNANCTFKNNALICDEIEINFAQAVNEQNLTLYTEKESKKLKGISIKAEKEGTSISYIDPTIKLQDADTENLDDTFAWYYESNITHGTSVTLRIREDSEYVTRTYIKFNISSIPSSQRIDSSQLYLWSSSAVSDDNVSVQGVNNYTWTEETLTWDNQPCGSVRGSIGGDCNGTDLVSLTLSSAGSKWFNFTVTSEVSAKYSNHDTVTFILYGPNENISDSSVSTIQSKESTYYGTGYRPYLNITYSSLSPTIPTNITCNGGTCNSTFSGTVNMTCSGSTDPNNDTITYNLYYANNTEYCSGTPQGCGNYTESTRCSIAGCTWSGGSGTIDENTSYNGEVTTTGTKVDDGYSASEVATQNCGQGTCSSSNSWEAGFDDANPANTQIDWYFNVSAAGINGSDVTNLTVFGAGCWHGGSARACEGDDPPEFSTNGNLDIYIYNWTGSSWVQIGTTYTISGSTGDDYQTYSRNKNSGFDDGLINSSGIIKIRYKITGTTIGSFYDVHGVYDIMYINITYSNGSCTGTPNACGTYNDSETNCTLVSCTWNPYQYVYIGNHTNGSTYSWDLSGFSIGKMFEQFRCYAIDLDGSNTPSDNYTQSSNFTVGAGGNPDINVTIWNGNSWLIFNDTNTFEFICSPTQTCCEPTHQDAGNSQSLFKVCNNGTADGTAVYAKLNDTPISGIDILLDDDYTCSGAVALTTSYQQIHGALTSSACIYVSMWANYSNPTSGGYRDIYFNIT